MKKFLALLLALCLIPLFAFGEVSGKGEYPITDEDITLKIWIGQTALYTEPDTMAQANWYEEYSGVKVEWQVVPSEEIEMMFNLATADKSSLPDIFLYAVNTDKVLELVEDGVIIPLDDLIEEYGYYYPQMLEETGLKDLVTAPDGHIYTMLAYVYLVQNSMYDKVWVLKDWLSQYNAAKGQEEGTMPETLDEFYDMLIYFRDNDMNGNGDNTDEIPLLGNAQFIAEGSDPMFYFLNSYLYCPNDFIVADADHNLSLSCTEDAFREGLKYIKKLYADNLLTPDTFTLNQVQMRQITSVYKNEAVAGVVAGMNPLRVVNVNPDPERVSYDSYVAIPPVKGPDGFRVTPRRAEAQLDLRCFITSTCEHPDVAYKWLDYWSSKEGSTWCSYLGQQGVHWDWTDEPSFGGDSKSVKSLVEWTSPQSVYFTITWFAQYYLTEDMFYAKAASRTPTDNELSGSLGEQVYLPYSIMSEFPQIVWCEDTDLSAEKAELTDLFTKYILNNCTKFIMGDKDLDSDADWQAFLDGLQKMDPDHYLEVVRAYYWGE